MERCWNGTFRLHRPDPSHHAFGYFYKQDTKKRYWDNNFVKWKGTFRSDLPKWPDRSKLTTFKAGNEYSRWNNRSFGNFGLNGKRPEPRRRVVQIKLTPVLTSKARYQNIKSFIPGKFPAKELVTGSAAWLKPERLWKSLRSRQALLKCCYYHHFGCLFLFSFRK